MKRMLVLEEWSHGGGGGAQRRSHTHERQRQARWEQSVDVGCAAVHMSHRVCSPSQMPRDYAGRLELTGPEERVPKCVFRVI
jgi:ribosomal protein L32